MTVPRAELRSQHVLLSATKEVRDQLEQMLTHASLCFESCASIEQFCEGIAGGDGAGVILMEMLTPRAMRCLVDVLGRQEEWSDFPLIVLCQPAEDTARTGLRMFQLLEPLGNVTILQQPVSALSFVSSVEAALRSRKVQMQVRDKIDQWNQMLQHRERFLSLLAHEVRNPLNSLRNAAQILGQVDPMTSAAIEQKTLIERQTMRLALLVDEVLSVFQLQSRRVRMRRDPIDLVDLATRSLGGVAGEAAAKRQEIRFQKPDAAIIVEGDSDRLHLILTDLLMHAIRSSPELARVEIQIATEGDCAIVTVRDSYEPASPEELERRFELFTDLDTAPDRSTEDGLPFGLTAVDGLVKLHRGTLSAGRAADGPGCEVKVRLPLCQSAPAESPRKTEAANGTRRVLVIEDNTDGRESLQFLLQLWGHHVETAADGPEGLAKLRSNDLDIALVDIGLPGMSGYDVVRSLRKSQKSVPKLIAMTGYGQPHDRQLALEAGFDSFLVKPIDAVQLHDLLAAAPARSSAPSPAAPATIG
jgi:signal transduction histidine kinase/ActR/RegA family two-component response regulator